VADPGFGKKKGVDHGEREESEPKRGSGGRASNGVQGRAPCGEPGGEAPMKLKAFCTFLHKKVAKSQGFK